MGKKLLHLQCHFGLDTLSWARLGAEVTGVDFSDEALGTARKLAAELNLPARFIHADLTAEKIDLGDPYDIIVTSYGVLSWLPTLAPWARLIAENLVSGGIFHIAEFHPVLAMMDEEGRSLKYPYFHSDTPLPFVESSSYAGARHEPVTSYQWFHSLSDVVTALLDARLRVLHLHELPYCFHGCYSFLVEKEPGKWVLRDHPDGVPLLFSIKAIK